MDYHKCQHLLAHTPAAKMLRLRGTHTALLLSFLHQEFKTAGLMTRAVMAPQLTAQLADYLKSLGYVPEADELPDAPAEAPWLAMASDPAALARRYLSRWADDGYLSLAPDESGQQWYDLTAASEKALQWLDSLEHREFVGTGSRLRSLFDQLTSLVEGSHADPTQRLHELHKDRERIDAEIAQIERTGQVRAYNNLEVREKFDLIVRQSKELGADFRDVDENLRQLLLDLYQQQLQATATKGQAVSFVLKARAALKEQDQGRSFYAFWEFLTGETQQQQLSELLVATDQLLQQRGLAAGPDLSFLRQPKGYLYGEARRVQVASEQLTDRLHRLVTSQHPRQHQRAHAATQAIQALALQLRHEPAPISGLSIAGRPALHLPWGRPPHGPQPPAAPRPAPPAAPVAALVTDLPAEVALALFRHLPVDTARLTRQLGVVLAELPSIGLPAVLARFPPTQGLAELVAYVALAAQQTGGRHLLDASVTVVVPLDASGQRGGLRVPHILYQRA